MSKEKRRFGDRRDGALIHQQDGMHLIMPMIYPNRCDNEAFISERIDLTNIDKYLEKRNAENPEFKFTLFHLIVAAILKTIILRPKLNRFIANKNNYQRNSYSASLSSKNSSATPRRRVLLSSMLPRTPPLIRCTMSCTSR